MSLGSHGTCLRNALINLRPNGDEGFEGLMAQLLGAWTGQKVRLAKAGYQAGRDIGTTSEATLLIKMEAKRYDATSLDERELLGEIQQVSRDVPGLDVWSLATTAVADEGLIQHLEIAAREKGFEVLILDWRGDGLSNLAVFCAAHPDIVLRHFHEVSAAPPGLPKALGALAKSSGFETVVKRLGAFLSGAAMGYDVARSAARAWFLEAVAGTDLSRDRFGQSSAVAAEPLIERRAVWSQLDQWWDTWTPACPVVAVLGEEGAGKTWSTFSWLRRRLVELDDMPLTLVFTSNRFPEPGLSDGIESASTPIPINALAHALADVTPLENSAFWTRRLKGWAEARLNERQPYLLIVLDGLNERPKTEWANFLSQVTRRLANVDTSIAVVVTSRPGYWEKRLADTERVAAKAVHVPGYDDRELDQALRPYGLTWANIPRGLQDLVRKPRYCDLVARHYERLEASGDLTVERLIYEDWRDRFRRRGGSLPFTDEDFRGILVNAAEKVRERPSHLFSANDLASFFPEDPQGRVLEELREGSLFVPHDGIRPGLKVEPTRLTHGLGLLLADDLGAAAEDKAVDLDERLDRWLEPHPAMDIKEQILRAACFYLLLQRREGAPSDAVLDVLLTRWLDSQNMDAAGEAAAIGFFRKAPKVYLGLAEQAWGDEWPRRLQGRLVASYQANFREDTLPEFVEAATRWCSYAVPEADGLMRRVRDGAQQRAVTFFSSLNATPSGERLLPAGPGSLSLTDNVNLLNLRDIALRTMSVWPKRLPSAKAVLAWAVGYGAMGFDRQLGAWAWFLRLTEEDLTAAWRPLVAELSGAGSACDTAAAVLERLLVKGMQRSEGRQALLPSPEQYFASWARENPLVFRPDFHLPRSSQAPQPDELGINVAELWTGPSQTAADYSLKSCRSAIGRWFPEVLARLAYAVLGRVQERELDRLERVAYEMLEYIPVLQGGERQVEGLANRLRRAQWESQSWAAADAFEAVLAHAEPPTQLAKLVEWGDEDLDLRAFDWLAGWDEASLASAYDALLDADATETRVSLFLALAQQGEQIVPESLQAEVVSALSDANEGLKNAALQFASCSAHGELVTRVIAALPDVRFKRPSRGPAIAAELLKAHGCDLEYDALAEGLPLPERSRVVGARRRQGEELRLADDLHDLWQVVATSPGEASPTFSTDWRKAPLNHWVSLDDVDEDLPEQPEARLKAILTVDNQARRQRHDERSAAFDNALRATANQWLDESFDRRAMAAVAGARPGLVDEWLEAVLPEGPTTNSLLMRCNGFYHALCHALMQVGDKRGALLWRRLISVRGVRSVDAETKIPTLLIDLFEAPDAAEVEALRKEVLEDLWSDGRMARFATAARLAGRQDWVLEQARWLMAEPALWRQAKGIALLAFAGAPPEEVVAALDADHRKETWLHEGREALVAYAEHEAFARYWYREILTQPERLVWWGHYFVFLACTDVRYWAWRAEIEGEVKKAQPIEPFRLTFLRRVEGVIRNAGDKNANDWDKKFLGIPIPDLPIAPFDRQVYGW